MIHFLDSFLKSLFNFGSANMKYSAITFLAVSLLCVGRGGHAESGSAADKAGKR